MAIAPATALIPVDEYLNTSYEYGVEYVDGVLVQKNMPTVFHGLLQAILIRWFGPLEKEYRFKAVPEVRTRIIERARYRIPDILLFTAPARLSRVLTLVPDVVIEILSPGDHPNENLDRFADYRQIGVPHIIQMDPEKYIAWRYQDGLLVQTEFLSLSLSGRPDLPFDSAALFDQLRREVAETDLPDSF